MGLMDFVKGGVRELAIARPDAMKGLPVYKHPDQTIPNKAQLTVGMDEVAMFFKDGAFVGQVGAGRHSLESSNLPFLNMLIDKFTGGNVFKAEIWFVTTREMAGYRFGGKIGDVEDPKSGLAIQTMVYGEYSIQVTDPQQVIQFFGLRSFASDEEFTGWFCQLLLKTIRETIASQLVQKQIPLLQVTSGAMTTEIEVAVIEAVKSQLASYGFKVVRLGNFVVSIKEEDEKTLKGLYKDAAQMKMVGGLQNYQQYAAGKAMMSAGEGGEGGSNPIVGGMGAGIGLGMAMSMAQKMQQPGQGMNPPAATEATVSVEDRLKKLKSLKEAGVIDEAEYATKRTEILKDL